MNVSSTAQTVILLDFSFAKTDKEREWVWGRDIGRLSLEMFELIWRERESGRETLIICVRL